jgi:hypothetical protein
VGDQLIDSGSPSMYIYMFQYMVDKGFSIKYSFMIEEFSNQLLLFNIYNIYINDMLILILVS